MPKTSLPYPLSLMSWRAGTRGNYPYHSLGRLASLRGCEVLLVVVQASVGYCVLYGCLSRLLRVDVAPLRPRASVRVSEMDGKDCTEPKGAPQRYWLRLVAHAAARVAAPQVGPH